MPANVPASRWHATRFSVAVFVFAASCSALIVWRLDYWDIEAHRARTLDLSGDYAYALKAQIEHSLSAARTMAALVRQADGGVRDFEAVAAQMLPSYPGVSALRLVPKGALTQADPLAGNEGTTGHDLPGDASRGQDTPKARDGSGPTLAGPFALSQGGMGAVGRLPVFLGDAGGQPTLWGYAVVVLRFPEALAGARLSHLAYTGYRYELWSRNPETGAKQVIDASPAGAPQDPVERNIEVANATWTLSVSPAAGWSNLYKRGMMAGWAVLMSLFLAFHMRLLLELQSHRRGLESLVAKRTAEVRAREADLNRAQSIAQIGSWVSTPDGAWRGSDEACRIFGVPEGSVLADSTFLERIHAEDRETVREAHRKVQGGEPSRNEFRIVDGERIRWVLGQAESALDVEGQPRRIVSTVQDITERKAAEADLRIAAAAFEAKEGMLVTDANGVILRVNRACCEITGYSAEEAVGKSPKLFRSGKHDDAFYADMWRAISETGAWQGEIWNRRKNGEVFPEWLGITAVRNEAGRISHYIGTLNDITQRKAAEAEIEHLAYFDTLTGLPNRLLLQDRLHRAILSSARKRRQGAILFVDLDDFKTLNDTQGHDMGDVLLVQVAERLSACVREGDTVARLGGDEYVVMLEDLAAEPQEAANQTESIGDMLLARIGVPYKLSSGSYHQTASIGIVLFGEPKDTVDDLLKCADLAMYRAKAAGGNALRFYDPEMQGTVTARAALVADLRQGLQEGEFQLVYQAQVDRQGRLLGAEALVRWHSPTRGTVSPVDFIPLAEETGLIVPLGQWIMEAACEQLVRWGGEPDTIGLTLSVNVSAREFRHPDFVARTFATLARTGADSRKLMLEFTESVLLNDFEGTVSKMNALKSRGVTFALDDFGTGYSSLAYLKHLPVDQLKIDKSFVRDVLVDPNDAMISRAIVALAQSLGLAVVAEGVESEAQCEFLARQGCDVFQGSYFGAPGAAEALRLFVWPARSSTTASSCRPATPPGS
jgi:diguanylate cyclase (GGDEF)-like protein/PAS domain S-box-containing protein